MLIRKLIGFLMVCSLLVFGTTACGKSTATSVTPQGESSQPVTLTFVNWATAEESTKKMTLDTIAEFEKQNPNIKIKSVPIPVSDILNQLTIMNSASNAPDIAQVDNASAISLASMGALASTDKLLSQTFMNDMDKASYELGLMKDQHYAIPWAGQPMGLWYNKKLMGDAGLNPNNPPKTMDELNKDMEIAKQKLPNTVVLLQVDTTIRTIGLEQEWPLMESLGAIKDGKINASQMGPYAEWLRGIIQKGYTLPGKKFGEFRPLAAQNNLLFGIDEPCFKGIVQSFDKTITDEKFNQTWAVTKLPDGTSKSYCIPGNHNLVVFKASKNQAAAAKFAEFLAGSDFALKNYILPTGYVPVVKSASQRFPQQFSDPSLKSFAETVAPTEVRAPWGPDYSKYATDVMTSMQEVITTTKPIPDILNNLQKKLQEYK